MSRLLPPLLLAIGALGGGWWLGSRSVESAQGSAAAGPGAPSGESVSESPPAAGLARRSALLKNLENPSAAEIQRLLDAGKVHGADVFELAKRWAKQDPAGMWNWLKSGGRKKLGHADVTNLLFEEWFRTDADAAIAAFRSAGSDFKSNAARGMLSLLLTADAKLLQKLTPLLDELTAGGAALSQGLGKEPEDAAKLLALPASKGRDMLLAETAHAWLDRDWKGATAWAATLTEPLKSKILSTLVSAALNSNVRYVYYPGQKEGSFKDDACFAWAREWFTTSAPQELCHRLGPQYVEALAKTDAGAALAWAQENLSARPLATAVTKVLAWSAGSASARTMVEQLPPGGVKQRAAFAAAGGNNAESVQWLMTQVDRKATEWGTVGSQWAFSDPDSFRKFVTPENLANLPNGLLSGAAGNLARKDPAGTLAWAAGLKSAELTGSALTEWSRADGPAAAAWLKEHPGTAVRSSGVQMVADSYFRRTPADAVAWVAALPPGSFRDTAIKSIRVQMKYSSLEPDARASFERTLGKP